MVKNIINKSKFSVKELINNSNKYIPREDLSFLKREKYERIFLYVIDTILLSYVYLYLSVGLSGFLNAFFTVRLDAEKSNLKIFIEVSIETFLIIIMVYAILYFVPSLPSIVPYPNKNHRLFRAKAASVIVAMSITFGQQRLMNKYQFLVGVDYQDLA